MTLKEFLREINLYDTRYLADLPVIIKSCSSADDYISVELRYNEDNSPSYIEFDVLPF